MSKISRNRNFLSKLVNSKKLLTVSVILLFILAGCNNEQDLNNEQLPSTPPSNSPSNPSAPSTDEDSYPPRSEDETAPDTMEPYPLPTFTPQAIESYPSPEENLESTVFALNTPIKAGDTTVTGLGPSNVAVFLVNVTSMGETLGSATIDNNGTFSITVPPLPANIQVGISADLEAAGISPSSIAQNDGALAVPLVGFYYDTAIVMEN